MFFYFRKRLHRAPLPLVALILFAMICAVIIGRLHHAHLTELQNRGELYQTIPVKLTVTSLQGTKANDLQAPKWVAEVVTGKWTIMGNLGKYFKDVLLESSCDIYALDLGQEEEPPKPTKSDDFPQQDWVDPSEENPPEPVDMELVGINALQASDSFLPEKGVKIFWHEGYSEELFKTEQWACLVPQSLNCTPGQTLTMYFRWKDNTKITGPVIYESKFAFKVVGTYTAISTDSIYCPFGLIEQVCASVSAPYQLDAISATLIDNTLLDDLRADRGFWFAAPNATGEKTPWKYQEYTYYPYALDINDTVLQRTMKTVDNTILINRLCSYGILVLASLAGFLIGFLVIRSRKREIALMRTMGTSNVSVYFGLAIEQMLCVIIGAVAGGAGTFWQPVQRLCVFVGVYFVGLTVALVVFLCTNLLSSMKEEE